MTGLPMMKTASICIQETSDWVALNKPSGLLSIPDREGREPSLKDHLRATYGSIFTVHRLDRDTSGLIVFARTEKAHKELSRQFEHRETEKIYLGLISGSIQPSAGSIHAPILEHPAHNGTMIVHQSGKEAHTDYEVLESYGPYSWVQFRIHTGRTHQIRVHMKDLGRPIVCDPIYGNGEPVRVSALKSRYKLSKTLEEERPILQRLALHAYRLRFLDLDGQMISLEAPLPKDLRATLQQLEKNRKNR
ncbi:MAG: hypothetical protein RJA57_157 [Bacteroidota bacterium]|jgi:23S rRNA pseudouridine955/2504/2580 synthase/23S rRNA pseudouridine1911/1915/1917 synthase